MTKGRSRSNRDARHPPLNRLPIYLMVLVLLTPASIAALEQRDRYEITSTKLMSEVLEDAEFAISERNMRIVERLHIGKGIRNRGHGKFPDYEVILFCNLTYARQALELEPGFIDFCPFKVTFREIGDKILIAAPLLLENSNNRELDKVAVKINSILREIVEFAAKEWFIIHE